MNAQELIDTARTLVAGDKGLLAMDESNRTCNIRFAKLGIPQTEEARRAWRELILTTPGLGEWMADPGWNRPTGGERGVDVARRSSMVLDEIERTLPSGNVLVVSHKATVRIMLCSLLGIDVGRYRDRLSMPVAAVSLVEMTAQGPLLKVLGDRTHLRGGLRLRPGT